MVRMKVCGFTQPCSRLSLWVTDTSVCSSDSTERSFDEDAYYECLGTRPPLEAESLGSCYQRVVELFYVCTEEDSRKRPSASQIVQALDGLH